MASYGLNSSEFEEVMINSELNKISEVFESVWFSFFRVTGKRVQDITDALIEDELILSYLQENLMKS